MTQHAAPLQLVAESLAHLPPKGYGLIYLIIAGGWVYVGQSRRKLPVRWGEHAEDLVRMRHVNDAMSAVFRQLGPDAFTGTVLELVPLAQLDAREIQWIEWFRVAGYQVANER